MAEVGAEQRTAYSQRLRAAVHYTVGCLCEEIGENKQVEFSKQTIAAISETTFRQCENFAKDLERFAKHGKRTTINTDDVKLLARRSKALELTKSKKSLILKLLAGLLEIDDHLSESGFTYSNTEEAEESSREGRSVAGGIPRREQKAPCKLFFWKTFSHC
ncbi:centromere protein S isoform X1 [Hemitrygon akajei]|uniref:centromere protein S isoform X1 n=1 Tax=Hemitrygon akajei TaxID=2704970 RepID=UPI003BF99CC5